MAHRDTLGSSVAVLNGFLNGKPEMSTGRSGASVLPG